MPFDNFAKSPVTRTRFYFFVGTVAELIKVMPVMRELSARGLAYKIIASGQNDLGGEELFAEAGLHGVDISLSDKPIRKSVAGLFGWFFTTFFRGASLLQSEFRGSNKSTLLIVHGDTLSTLMGAIFGKMFGLRVAHVEAGLRSHNFLQPFPEEIDRYLTAFLADIHFAPSQGAVNNLHRRRGEKVNTGYNTNLDSLAFAQSRNRRSEVLNELKGDKFWIFIMHRQENLLNKPVVRETVRAALEAAQSLKCVFVIHEATRAVLEEVGMLEALVSSPNVLLTARQPYSEFISLLEASEFIVTDGGGNQQECFYLGKPCLLLRHVTEGDEGIGGNVVVGKNDVAVMRDFVATYRSYRRDPVRPPLRPSEIIVDVLTSR